MADANVRLEIVPFGMSSKPARRSPQVEAAVKAWTRARRSGNRKQTRAAYEKLKAAWAADTEA